MKFILNILLLVSAGVASAQTSYVPATRTLGEKGYQLGLYGDMFTTTKAINENGNSKTLGDNESFRRLQAEIFGLYGLTNQIQVGLGARFRHNQSTFADLAGNDVTATGSGLESTSVLLMYAFAPVDRLQYTLEGLFRYTPFTSEEFIAANQEDLILGDEGNEVSIGLGVTYASAANNFFTVRGGLRKPGKQLSREVYWQAEGAIPFSYVALVAGVDGVFSLNSDPYAGIENEKPIFNTGVSELYNSTDREWIAPYAGLNIALGKSWRVEFKGSQVVSGNSTDLGTSFGVSLIRRVDTSKERVDENFKEYDLEATITKVSPKQEFVVLDKGLSDDFEKGMRVDIFEFDFLGGNVLLARGVVTQVKASTSIVQIIKRFNTAKELKVGQIVRGILK